MNSRLCKRIIPCLDVADGRTVKGVNFQNLRDVGDPVELAKAYEDQGADELVFLDISASIEGRNTMLHVVEQVAQVLSIPFTVGGGIKVLPDVTRLLEAGADKVSVNTAAVVNPQLILDISTHCGSQCCVLAIDARRASTFDGWEVLTHGGKTNTGLNALAWAQQAVTLGAGEILLTSWDKDGTHDGFDLPLTKVFAESLSIPVIASGGASGPQSFIDVFEQADADAALAASIFHDGLWRVDSLKDVLRDHGLSIRTSI